MFVCSYELSPVLFYLLPCLLPCILYYPLSCFLVLPLIILSDRDVYPVIIFSVWLGLGLGLGLYIGLGLGLG